MVVRGIRGAAVSPTDTSADILQTTSNLLLAMQNANTGLDPADVASIYFTTTPDLTATFPAYAARQIGWTDVPLLGAQELPVPGSLPRCIRILIHWNTDLTQNQINHVYLGEASQLRPDLSNPK